eukprot:scaffold7675_cov277-Pinguiococcus_pyrenoidosus.AAC.8
MGRKGTAADEACVGKFWEGHAVLSGRNWERVSSRPLSADQAEPTIADAATARRHRHSPTLVHPRAYSDHRPAALCPLPQHGHPKPRPLSHALPRSARACLCQKPFWTAGNCRPSTETLGEGVSAQGSRSTFHHSLRPHAYRFKDGAGGPHTSTLAPHPSALHFRKPRSNARDAKSTRLLRRLLASSRASATPTLSFTSCVACLRPPLRRPNALCSA